MSRPRARFVVRPDHVSGFGRGRGPWRVVDTFNPATRVYAPPGAGVVVARLDTKRAAAIRARVLNTEDLLYEAARAACHESGLPWTDPRTGRTWRARGRR
jgi:hypothetical protein